MSSQWKETEGQGEREETEEEVEEKEEEEEDKEAEEEKEEEGERSDQGPLSPPHLTGIAYQGLISRYCHFGQDVNMKCWEICIFSPKCRALWAPISRPGVTSSSVDSSLQLQALSSLGRNPADSALPPPHNAQLEPLTAAVAHFTAVMSCGSGALNLE